MMMNEIKLKEKKCIPCEGGTLPLTQEEISDYRKQINKEWNVIDDKKISKEYAFVNYRHTMDFVNKVADLAEKEGHHPVMHVFYGRLQIELWTHAIEGLSENDFIMAAKIDDLS
jgi:4a-hydroxytetrahydrobiopterin dehydratase